MLIMSTLLMFSKGLTVVCIILKFKLLCRPLPAAICAEEAAASDGSLLDHGNTVAESDLLLGRQQRSTSGRYDIHFAGCCGCSLRSLHTADGEHLSLDRLSAVGSTMAAALSGEQSNLTSSDSVHTARFGGISPAGDDHSFAAPILVTGPEVELPAIEDAEEGREFAQSYLIADAVMNSFSTSLTTSNVMG